MNTETIRQIIMNTIDEFDNDHAGGHVFPMPTANAAAPVFDLCFNALSFDEQDGSHFILYNASEKTKSFTDTINPLGNCDGWYCYQHMDFDLMSVVFAERVTDKFGYPSLRLTLSDGSQYAVTITNNKED